MIVVNYEADELLMHTCTAITTRNYILTTSNGNVKILGEQYYSKGRFNRKLVYEKLSKLQNKNDWTIELKNNCDNFNLATLLIDKEIKKMYAIFKADRVDLWLGPTNKSNFRFKSAVTTPYKNNRDEKPKIHSKLRDYILHKYAARVIEGYESDDALGIYQTENTVAAHYDKDINQIPGKHYHTVKDIHYEVNDPGYLHLSEDKKTLKGTGLAFFYAQMLMGDRTDSILSLPHPKYRGYGAKLTYDVLKECNTESDYLNTVLDEYKNVLGDNYKNRLFEQADLVWICRKKDETGRNYLENKL